MKLNNNDDSHNSGLNLLIYNMLLDIESHPAWVCGLKHWVVGQSVMHEEVTPCVGVWIETSSAQRPDKQHTVTPCVGVWIETTLTNLIFQQSLSHPAWVCGLKHVVINLHFLGNRHTLRGCVD